MSDPIPAALAKRVGDGDVILFVGSGVSRTAGLSLWKEVAADLIREALDAGEISAKDAADLQSWDAQSVGDRLLHRLKPTELAGFYRRHFWSEQQSAVHDAIARLGIGRIITTNWDCMLERTIASQLNGHDPLRPWQNEKTASFTSHSVHQSQADAARKGVLRSWIYHWHGIYYIPETVIWSMEAYHAVQRDRFAVEFMSETLRDKQVLYIGFGFGDSDFDNLLTELRTYQGASLGRQYAILPDVSRMARERYRSMGLTPISYDLNPTLGRDEAHASGLLEILDQLATDAGKVPAGQAWRTSRIDGNIRARIANEVALSAKGMASGPIRIYGSAGRDFLRDHEAELVNLLKNGVTVQLLLFDPRTEVLLGDGSRMGVHDWRSGSPVAASYSSAEYREFLEAQELIGRLRKNVGGKAKNLRVRFTAVFPRSTICEIGASVFDCPRPLKQLSVQGPVFEYRKGSPEHQFFVNSFDVLWGTGIALEQNQLPQPQLA